MQLARILPLLIAAQLAAIAQADVLNVRGPAPDHQQIAAAVAAAQDGDVIRVWPGTYQGFTVLDLALSIVPAQPDTLVRVTGSVTLRDLAAGKSLSLNGLEVMSSGPGLRVVDCAGSVRVRECVFEAGFDASDVIGPPGGSISNSDDVELAYSSFIGGYGVSWEQGVGGGSGLVVETSRVSIYTSTCVGHFSSADDDPGASGFDGGHGIVVGGSGSRAYVSGCTLVGGDGGDADFDPDLFGGGYGFGGDGGSGVWSFGAELWLLDNVYQPGDGGWSPAPGQQGQPGQAAPANANWLPGVSRLTRASSLVTEGGELALRFVGAPGDAVFLRVALAPAYQFSEELGPLLLAAPPLEPFGAARPFTPARGWRFLGAVGANGTLLTAIPAPLLPDFGHRELHVQAAFVGAQRYYGSSSWSVVLDSAW